MKAFNMYLCGVGGQGIGLLAEILLRAADHGGHTAKLVDTHGLAQRGGIVISHLRLGSEVFSPMVGIREADLAVALERHEAMRAADASLKDGASLIYYDTVLQPLGVRLGRDKEVSVERLNNYCESRKITAYRIRSPQITDHRMQNIAVLAGICRHRLIPQVGRNDYLQAMEDLMQGTMLESNRTLFNQMS